MVQFTEIIEWKGETLEVSFTEIFTVKGHIFFIGIQKQYENYFFDMIKNGPDRWMIQGAISGWIKELESVLSETIVKYLKNEG